MMIDKFINKTWFLLNYLRYKRFIRKVKTMGYRTQDIWFHWTIGFFCMPDNQPPDPYHCKVQKEM